MLDLLEAMIEEDKQLFDKLQKLNEVISRFPKNGISPTEFDLLKEQSRYMACYGYTLKTRIAQEQDKMETE